MKPLVVLLLIAMVSLQCSKEEKTPDKVTPVPTPVPTISYKFTWSEIPAVTKPSSKYQAYRFSTTVAKDTALLWDFGDGTTSADTAPEHYYLRDKLYMVSLTVNGDTAHKVTKKLITTVWIQHDFFWNGLPFIDSAIYFSSNAVNSAALVWDFGDGTVVTGSSPEHSYRSTGTYSVKLTIDGDTTNAIIREIGIYPLPLYTNLLGGMRSWHDTLFLTHFSEKTPKTDKMFALNYVNPVKVKYDSIITTYLPQSSNDSILFFSGRYNYFAQLYRYISIKYYVRQDSVRIFIPGGEEIGAYTEILNSYR